MAKRSDPFGHEQHSDIPKTQSHPKPNSALRSPQFPRTATKRSKVSKHTQILLTAQTSETVQNTVGKVAALECVPAALSGANLFIFREHASECCKLEKKALECGATVSQMFDPYVTHLVIPISIAPKWKNPTAFWKLISSNWPALSLRSNFTNKICLSSAIVARFIWEGRGNLEQQVYIVSETWVEESHLMGYRLSEANYVPVVFCSIFPESILAAMEKLIKNTERSKVAQMGKLENLEELNKKYMRNHSTDTVTVAATAANSACDMSFCDDSVSLIELERNRPESELVVPKVGDWVETKSTHEDSQIFKAKVLERWRADGTWMFRLKSPDIGATYCEPLRNVRAECIWSTTQLVELGRGRKSRRSSRSSLGNTDTSGPYEMKRCSVNSASETSQLSSQQPPSNVSMSSSESFSLPDTFKAESVLPNKLEENGVNSDTYTAPSLIFDDEFVVIHESQGAKLFVNPLEKVCSYDDASDINELVVLANKMIPSPFAVNAFSIALDGGSNNNNCFLKNVKRDQTANSIGQRPPFPIYTSDNTCNSECIESRKNLDQFKIAGQQRKREAKFSKELALIEGNETNLTETSDASLASGDENFSRTPLKTKSNETKRSDTSNCCQGFISSAVPYTAPYVLNLPAISTKSYSELTPAYSHARSRISDEIVEINELHSKSQSPLKSNAVRVRMCSEEVDNRIANKLNSNAKQGLAAVEQGTSKIVHTDFVENDENQAENVIREAPKVRSTIL